VSTPTADLEIGESRRRLLREVGSPPDLTVVRCHEGPGYEPAWAGIEELLRGHIYREIDRDRLCAARGHTALLAVDVLGAHAGFYARHGKLLDLSLFDLVPSCATSAPASPGPRS
jgi:hypothetical protein